MGEIQQQQPHVAVLAFSFGTHAGPLLNLTRKLAAAAPHVTFSFFNTPKSNASLFGPKTQQQNDASLPNIKAFDVDDGVPEGYVFTGKRQEDIELFHNATPENFIKELDTAVLQTRQKISCLITDAFFGFAADLAQEMKVPWVAFWTAGAAAFSAHLYTDLVRHTFQPGTITAGGEEMPLTLIPGMPSGVGLKDLPLEVLGSGGNTAESVLSRLLHEMARIIPRATTIVINSFQELDPSVIDHLKSKFHHCLAVGPFNLTSTSAFDRHDPYGCLPWLNQQKPASVAYVSFGTITTLPPIEVASLAEALEESGVAFMWSLKESETVHVPKGFLERSGGRGMIVPWAPQSGVLEHTATGVFVTHCGWNSVLESIAGGVPMICRPFFGDQRLNSRLVSAVWGIGLGARDGILRKDGVMDALDLILRKQGGQLMRHKVVALQQIAKQAVSPTGTSTQNFNTLLKMVSSNS